MEERVRQWLSNLISSALAVRLMICLGAGRALISYRFMNALNILKNQPDDALEIHDDKSVVAFLHEVGLEDAFADVRTLSDKPTVQICGFDGVKTHFILAFLFSGCSPANDNGYHVSCAPRNAFEPGLSTPDFVASAAREPKFKSHRVIIRALLDLN
jgi:hypothetical protein